MIRGFLDSIAQSPVYANSEKDWCITLQQSTCYWYELIVNPPDCGDTKSGIGRMLNDLRSQVEKTFEKRFIYFFASRPRVRFDTSRRPYFEFFSKKLVLHLLVGRAKKRVILKTVVRDIQGNVVTPSVELSERFVTIFNGAAPSEMYSVHDFLQYLDFSIGASTTIHYVGITKNPADRPLNRKHRGITDTLYNISNEENDFFIYINLFKVTAHAKNLVSGFAFVTANSMTDEIKTDEEGAIVEGALISYFECKSQRINRDKERASFRRRLNSVANKNKIHSVAVHIEVEQPSEYFAFGSESVPPAHSHTFVFESVHKGLELTKLGSEEELLSRIQPKQ